MPENFQLRFIGLTLLIHSLSEKKTSLCTQCVFFFPYYGLNDFYSNRYILPSLINCQLDRIYNHLGDMPLGMAVRLYLGCTNVYCEWDHSLPGVLDYISGERTVSSRMLLLVSAS